MSTALVSAAALDGFRAAFTVICGAAALGAITAAVVFPRRVRPAAQPTLDSQPQAGNERVPIQSPCWARRATGR